MPHRETDVSERLDNLESSAYDRRYIDADGVALSDILPTDLELESVTAGAGGAFVILSWMGWQPEVETYEIWLESPDQPAEKIGEFATSPATLTINVKVDTPVVLTVRARAGERTVGFAQSPSVAALIPAPISGALTPNSVGDSHLIHMGTDRIVIKNADILTLTANKLTAGTIDAGVIDVINLNADNINAGSLSADRITTGSLDASIVNIINFDVPKILTGMGAPDDANGNNNDTYIQANGAVWRKVAGAWSDTGVNLTGTATDGDDGDDGEDGATVLSGDVAAGATPAGSGTTIGDIFFATDGRWWRWDGTAWIFRGDLTGRDGPGSEWVFRVTLTNVAPALVQLTAAQRKLDDQFPADWLDDPQGVDETNQFEWVAHRARNSAGSWSEFSDPGLWAVYRKDGTDASNINRGTLNAAIVNVTNIKAGNIKTGTLDASVINVIKLNASNIKVGTLTGISIVGATITGGLINAELVDITNIDANKVNRGTLNAAVVNVININAGQINAGILNAAIIRVINIDASNINTGNLNASRIRSGILDASVVSVIKINASRITTGTLSANRISGGTIDATSIRVIKLDADNINRGEIDAAVVNVVNLNADNIVTGTLSADSISAGTLTGSEFSLVSANENMLVTGAAGFKQFSSMNKKYVSIISGRAYFGITVGTEDHDLLKIDANEPIPDYSVNVGSISFFSVSGQPKLHLGGDANSIGGHITGHITRNNIHRTTFQLLANGSVLYLGRSNVQAGRLVLYPAGALGTGGGELLAITGGIQCGFSLLPLNSLQNIGSATKRWGTVYAQSLDVPVAAPDVAGFFSVSPTRITPGESARLLWTTSHATGGAINQGIGNINAAFLASGTVTVTPAVDTTYTLTLQGEGGPLVLTTKIVVSSVVLNQPSITSFAADNSNLTPTQRTTIRWTTTNGVSGRVSGSGLDRALSSTELNSGTRIGPLTAGTHSFTLVINGEAGTDPATVTFSVEVTAPVVPVVAIISFIADPTTLVSGRRTSLSWRTANATGVTLDTFTVALNGSENRSPTETTEYVLRATDGTTTITARLTVTVALAVTIDTLTADDASIASGESTDIRWTTSNATGVTLDGEDVDDDGSSTISPTKASNTYTLRATGAGGPISKTVTVLVSDGTVVPPPTAPVTIDSFTADDISINVGESVTFNWRTSNATGVKFHGPSQLIGDTVNGDGRKSLVFRSDGSFDVSLVATGVGGPITKTVTVTVTVPPVVVTPLATIDSFTASSSRIDEGDSITLRWRTSNADSVTLDGEAVNDDDTKRVSPTVDTTYTLRATGPGANPDPETVTVTVTPARTPPPVPEVVSFSASSTRIALGSSVTLRWSTRNGDVRDLTSKIVGNPESSRVTINGAAAASGSRSVSPLITTTYTMNTWNAADPSTADKRSVTVTVIHPRATIDSFSATTPNAQGRFTISWETTGAQYVILDSDDNNAITTYAPIGGNRSADGSYTATELSGTTIRYRLRAFNQAGGVTIRSGVTVTVP